MAQKITYFIDVENVGSKDIATFLGHEKTSSVVVVTGKNSNFKAEGAILEELSKGKNSRIDVIHTDITRDQLADKLLLVKIGEYHARFVNRQLIIVSKDNGFKDAATILNSHWSTNIQTASSLPKNPVNGKKKPTKIKTPGKKQPKKKAIPKKQQPNDEWKKYWEIVSKREKRNRAKTHDALVSSISNIKKAGIKANPDSVIQGLIVKQKVSIKNGKITWLD
jgi:hypothetical protein